MEQTPIKGSCLCGGVAFEIMPPIIFFQYCHCSRCRKATGSAHGANIFLKAAQLSWTSGEDLVRRREMPEARYYCTAWCDQCGSALPWRTRNDKYYLVPAGALDDDPEARPTRNIFWGSRAEWFVEHGELLKHEEEA